MQKNTKQATIHQNLNSLARIHYEPYRSRESTKTCEYAAAYQGVDVRMYAYLEMEKDEVAFGDE